MRRLPKSFMDRIRTERLPRHMTPLLLLLLLGSALLSLCLGPVPLSLRELLGVLVSRERSGAAAGILLYVRLPRTAACLLAGAALALSGAVIQSVLGNPLAAPNVIGVNSGAVSAVFSGAIDMVLTFVPDSLSSYSDFRIGGFSGVSMRKLLPAAAVILPAGLTVFLLSAQLEILTLGADAAQALGLRVRPVRVVLLTAAAALAGASVSMAGLIGFVGLIVPHAARKYSEGDSLLQLAFSALGGASFVTLCDLLSRTLFAPYEMPVGVVLSFLGGPFFLWLILRQRGGRRRA